MKKALKIAGWTMLILLAAIAIFWFGILKPKPSPVSDEDRASVTLMALPAVLKSGKGEFILDQSLAHDFSSLSDPAALKGKEDELKKLYISASGSYGATNLSVVAHVQKLVEFAAQN
jgi:hypothetical protein